MRAELAFAETWWPPFMAPADCPPKGVLRSLGHSLEGLTDQELECLATVVAWNNRLGAAKIIFIPPLMLLIAGSLIMWIARGFVPQSK
jgi:hypothetical protein